MKTRMKKDRRGFTIIEVVLVLAIAGLIFLMIFVALPALQRSQRDAQRRNDISLLLTKIMNYQTNNRGALPTNTPAENSAQVTTANLNNEILDPKLWQSFYNNYFDDNFRDPRSGETYTLWIISCGASTRGSTCNNKEYSSSKGFSENDIAILKGNYRTILINVGATCNGETAVQSNNPRKVAAQYFLEGGGIYCANT